MIFFDTETYPFRPGCMAPKIVSLAEALPTPNHTTALGLKLWDPAGRKSLAKRLEAGTELCGAFPSYDLVCYGAESPEQLLQVFDAYAAATVHDVLLRERLLDIAVQGYCTKYNLGRLAKKYCGADLDKGDDSWQTRFAELEGVPVEDWPEEAVKYALGDVAHLPAIFAAQEKWAGLIPDWPRQMRAQLCLQLNSVWGMRTDRELVDRVGAEVHGRIRQLREYLADEGLVTGSKKEQKKVHILTRRESWKAGLQPSMTDQGNVQVDAQAASLDPRLAAYHQLSPVEKMLTPLTTLELAADAPYHPRYDLLVTGRANSSRNVQNFGREGPWRKCVVPSRKGWILCVVDFGGAELATFAQCCLQWVGCSEQARVLNQGNSLHNWLAARLVGVADSEFDQSNPAHAHARQLAKAGNFSYQGGAMPRMLQAIAADGGVEMTLSEAEQLHEVWLGADAAKPLYFQHIAQRGGVPEEVCRAWGEPQKMVQAIPRTWTDRRGGSLRDSVFWAVRHARSESPQTQSLRVLRAVARSRSPRGWTMIHLSGHVRAGCSFTDACNSPFQGLAADFQKDAMWLVQREAYLEPGSPLYGWRQWNNIHDELDTEGPEVGAEEAMARKCELMRQAAAKVCPDVRVDVEAKLLYRWEK